jgi:enoyl-CoA hydratase/carnithine racemase
LSGELFDAQHASDIGLVDELAINHEALIDSAVATARSAGAKAPVLYGALKRSINDQDEARDDAFLQRTLTAAVEYYDDPTARGLRERWSGRRASATKEDSCRT